MAASVCPIRFGWIVAGLAAGAALSACATSEASPATDRPAPSTQAPTPTRPPTEAPPPATPTVAPSPTPTQAAIQSLDPAAYPWAPIASGLDRPTYLTHAGDGTGRLFITEQGGAIRILQNGGLLPAPFLDLTPLVGSRALEQGLLSVAFHPDFERNGSFFVNYTDVNGDTVVARYAVSPDPNRADPDSARVLLQVDQPYPNHNGGQLEFGPGGYLYIGMGDGGSGGDPEGNGQNLGTLLGKLLRIDVNAGDPYAVPPDNPFVGRGGARGEIWAYGLRNPWRFSFDRATADLYIADVGQNAVEEVDVQPAGSAGGENYGWDLMEGSRPFEGGPAPGLVGPVAEYTHDLGCSITGGYVYRGPALPELHGVYFYGDWCSGIVWMLARDAGGNWQSRVVFQTGLNITSFGEDEAGELYLLDGNGGVYRLERRSP